MMLVQGYERGRGHFVSPVLSNAMLPTRPKLSRCCPPLTMTPFWARAASPATYVTGVEMISAQGQAIT
jgi:hypothetical protein